MMNQETNTATAAQLPAKAADVAPKTPVAEAPKSESPAAAKPEKKPAAQAKKRAAAPAAKKASTKKAPAAKKGSAAKPKKVAAKKPAAPKSAEATAKPAAVKSSAAKPKKVTLVDQTRKLVTAQLKLKSVDGDFAKLDRKKITGILQEKHGMTQGQASTYYHNEVRKQKRAQGIEITPRGKK